LPAYYKIELHANWLSYFFFSLQRIQNCVRCLNVFYLCKHTWEVGLSLTGLTPPYSCACLKPRLDFQALCSVCWYWLTSWPSLFKLSSHITIQYFINIMNLRFQTTCVPAFVLYTYATQTNLNNSTTLQAAIMYTVVVNYL